jgi:hypothetical protein
MRRAELVRRPERETGKIDVAFAGFGSRPRRLGALLLVVVVSAMSAGAASASPASRSSAETTASFCGVARGVASYLVHADAFANASGTESLATIVRQMKVTYTAIVKAEPALRSSVAHKLAGDLRKALAFVNYVYAEAKSVQWNLAALFVHQKVLVAKAAAVEPSLKHLQRYFRSTCHLKV